MVRGAPGRRKEDCREGRRGGGGARGGAQGARPDPPQERARHRQPARQARGLPGARPGQERIVHRRGRQRRRLGQAGPRPPLPGDPAAEGQDPQCRARPLRQDAVLGRDRHPDPGARHRHRQRGFRGGKGALSPHHHHDRRRCRRQPYPHAAVDVLLPADAGVDRKGLSLHRAAAALPPAARQRQAGLSEGRRGARGLSVQHGDPRRRVHAARRRTARRQRSARSVGAGAGAAALGAAAGRQGRQSPMSSSRRRSPARWRPGSTATRTARSTPRTAPPSASTRSATAPRGAGKARSMRAAA